MSRPASKMQAELNASKSQAEILEQTLTALHQLAEEAEMERVFQMAEARRIANYSPLELELRERFQRVEARRIEKTNNSQKIRAK